MSRNTWISVAMISHNSVAIRFLAQHGKEISLDVGWFVTKLTDGSPLVLCPCGQQQMCILDGLLSYAPQ